MILSKINREILWLLKGIQPKYRVIADFRKDNAEALHNVFESFVDLCIKLGLYGKELIAVDGTKIEASASKRKHYSKNKLIVSYDVSNNSADQGQLYNINTKAIEKLEVDSIEILTDKGYFHMIYKVSTKQYSSLRF
ncbi:transposase IS4 family domain protein [Clostridium sporogenes]|uniref:transposase n=1 Tax=Clostridium TaxID=1485 RepID=UPI000696A5DA|nr:MULTISPECIES: transposase [Clostridium]APF28124.1 transposase IS4 family domain protein [Clostridium sporogenes]MDI6919650.1 hypothetical protein [Clostridium botulinum]WMU96207.1 hypothetical protein QA656_10490 [Clostridium botulinum]